MRLATPFTRNCSICRAMSDNSADSNKALTGYSTPKLLRMRETNWIASTEWPPTAKKSIWAVTGLPNNTWHKAHNRACTVAPAGSGMAPTATVSRVAGAVACKPRSPGTGVCQ